MCEKGKLRTKGKKKVVANAPKQGGGKLSFVDIVTKLCSPKFSTSYFFGKEERNNNSKIIC